MFVRFPYVNKQTKETRETQETEETKARRPPTVARCHRDQETKRPKRGRGQLPIATTEVADNG